MYQLNKLDYPKIGYFRYVELELNKDIFIPRPETELIVENISSNFDNKNILELFSGSGAISCSILNEFEPKSIHVVEISEKIIPTLKKNISKYDTKKIAKVINFDAIDFLKNAKENSYDIILANPPYIPLDWKEKINVIDPPLALFSDTLPYQTIESAFTTLKKGGELIIEHFDYDQDKIADCFKKTGYKDIKKFNDLAQKPRFVKGTK